MLDILKYSRFLTYYLQPVCKLLSCVQRKITKMLDFNFLDKREKRQYRKDYTLCALLCAITMIKIKNHD